MLLCDVVLPRFPTLRPHSLWGLSALAFFACNYPKPPAAWTGEKPAPVAVAPVATPAPAPPPPPPPPRCEDLQESCTAGPDTKLAVGDSGAWFTPPAGWHYAREKGGSSIAVHPDGTAMIVLVPSPDPSDIAPAVESLVSERGVKGLKVEKLKRRLKKPQQSLPAGEGSVDLWEVDKGQQGESLSLLDKGDGTLLVLVGKPTPERTLLGIGFVVEAAAESEAPKIMQSVQTLRSKP